jgi:DHA2 family multidrug resistance protein-like MFS transporter
MGGAVGVAVFGSLMASHFHREIAHKIGSVLPAPVFAQVRDNVGQAVGVARQAAPARPFSGQIIDAAGQSFVSGLHIIGLVAACVTLTAAIGVALFLPARARDVDDEGPVFTPVLEPVSVSS